MVPPVRAASRSGYPAHARNEAPMRLFRSFFLATVSLGLGSSFQAAAQGIPQEKPVPRFLDPAAPAILAAVPPPPAPGSLADRADLETVLQVQIWRTPEQEALANRLVQDDPFKFAEVLGPEFSAKGLPQTAALLKQVLTDAYLVGSGLKDRFVRRRPHLEDQRVQPCVERSSSPSYPSGHATRAYVLAAVLSELYPSRTDALLAFARKAAWARVQGGIHYPSDLEGGRQLALAIVAAMQKSPEFQKALAVCKEELLAYRLRKAG